MLSSNLKLTNQRTAGALVTYIAVTLTLALNSMALTAQPPSLEDVCNLPVLGLHYQPGPGMEANTDHFYVIDLQERADQLASDSVSTFGVPADSLLPFTDTDAMIDNANRLIGYASAIPITAAGIVFTQPLYRVMRDGPPGRDNLYTIDISEAVHARDTFGYDALPNDGIQILGHISQSTSILPLRRLFSIPKQDHLYTTDESQADNFIDDQGYDDEPAQGSLFDSSRKLVMSDSRAVFCNGGAIRNANEDRARFYYQGPPVESGGTQNFSFDLWTGNFFSNSPREHFAVLMWGETGLEIEGGEINKTGKKREGRGLFIGTPGSTVDQSWLKICLEFFPDCGDDGDGDAEQPNLCDCEEVNFAQPGVARPLDNMLLTVDMTATEDRIDVSIFDSSGTLLYEPEFPDRPPPTVATGRTDIIATATNDILLDEATRYSFMEVRNASVAIQQPGADVQITMSPSFQSVVAGDDATFNIEVRNTGTIDLFDVSVSDAQAPDCVRDFGTSITAGGTRQYGCEAIAVSESFTNTATVDAQSSLGAVFDDDSGYVEVVDPVVEIDLAAEVSEATSLRPSMIASVLNSSTETATDLTLKFTAFSENGSAELRSIPPGCVLAPFSIGIRAKSAFSRAFSRQYICSISSLGAGEIFSVTWGSLCNGRLTPEGSNPTLVFTASVVDVAETDINESNDSASGTYFNSFCTD